MQNKGVVIGRYHVDISQNCLKRGEEKVYLGPLRANLLNYLCTNLNQVVGRDELAKNVWGRIVTDHTINQHISQLRKAVENLSMGELTIGTIPKKGYIAKLTSAEAPMAEPVAPEVDVNGMRVLILGQDQAGLSALFRSVDNSSELTLDFVADASLVEARLNLRRYDLLVIDLASVFGESLDMVKQIRMGRMAVRADLPVMLVSEQPRRELIGLSHLLDGQGIAMMDMPVVDVL